MILEWKAIEEAGMWMRHLEVVTHTSRILENNPMGNGSVRHSLVLPPPPSPTGSEPQLLMCVLSGYFGNGAGLLNDPGPLGISFGQMVWDMQKEGIFPPSLFVFPDGSTVLGGSQYINSTSCGLFMDHLNEEVVPQIEEGRFSKGPRRRVLMGHSSGGYGALANALLKPGAWGAVVASAADSAFDVSLQPLFGPVAMELEKWGGMEEFLRSIKQLKQPEKCSRSQFNALMMVAMASCYAPRPHLAPQGFGALPFDPSTAQINEEVWEEWLAWDLVSLVKSHGHHLPALWHLHLDCGAQDECGAQFGHRRIAQWLKEKGIAHTATEFAGGHSGTQWRWPLRLEMVAQSFKKTFG